ncbi:MAG: hypothetical protein A2V66_17875 [Ignavibacteria bacterium RBG_13_36_8]|nr:MAG: hypothetical protein A2V66_17875 [Ignavibacteria bacterium RBG_13_36_8]
MENKEYIRILIADDHQLFRSGIISLLNDVNDILIVGEAENGKELINKYFKLKPDIILLDISMPGMSGADAFKEIKRRDKRVKALFLSMYEGDEYIFYILKIGGMGLLNKNIMKGELIYAVRQVQNNQKYFGNNLSNNELKEIQKKFKKLADASIDEYITLSSKEKEILIQISEGKTSLEIAKVLKLSKRTIDSHRVNLMNKLKITSLPQLIKYAVKFSQAKKLYGG